MYHDLELVLQHDLIVEWKEHYKEVFGKHTLLLKNRLHELPVFLPENLARLIEATPSEHYDFVRPGAIGTKKSQWLQGSIEGAKGEDVLRAVEEGRFWLSLRALQEWDEGFRQITSKIFDELEVKVPGFETFKHKTGMLISSPGAQVYYHADVPGQSLWQVKGHKDVYIYENTDPFLSDEQLEGIFLGTTEEEIRFEPWYDEFATKVTLSPGEMAHWPLNNPHRVENHDEVNISVTTEHFTKEIRDFYAIVYANGLLRAAGISGSRHSLGAMKYAKMALAAAHKMVYKKMVRQASSAKSPRSFKLDMAAPDFMSDL
ncbi:transcriptional regulator [Pseudovibrio brasiliensis]|uniref:Transcriptional regulator n=1 Tax=Pseudovibrio brasiliensis TaxID=1898042 RepID=A0ABX8AKK8_9HYPH|nr:transcriptional regulator [Pseudovibrio brasiliensis]QUS54797.1 transcriptional regulator [Pseudovibrio brasiliensis]